MGMRLLLAALLSCAACGPSRFVVPVQKQAGIDGAWKTGDVILRVKGDTATLEFMGRTFVIRDFGAFQGHISPERVLLHGRDMEFRVTAGLFEVGHRKGRPQRWKLSVIPKGSRAVYDGRDLRVE